MSDSSNSNDDFNRKAAFGFIAIMELQGQSQEYFAQLKEMYNYEPTSDQVIVTNSKDQLTTQQFVDQIRDSNNLDNKLPRPSEKNDDNINKANGDSDSKPKLKENRIMSQDNVERSKEITNKFDSERKEMFDRHHAEYTKLSNNQYAEIKGNNEQTPEMAAKFRDQHTALREKHHSEIKGLDQREQKELAANKEQTNVSGQENILKKNYSQNSGVDGVSKSQNAVFSPENKNVTTNDFNKAAKTEGDKSNSEQPSQAKGIGDSKFFNSDYSKQVLKTNGGNEKNAETQQAETNTKTTGNIMEVNYDKGKSSTDTNQRVNEPSVNKNEGKSPANDNTPPPAPPNDNNKQQR